MKLNKLTAFVSVALLTSSGVLQAAESLTLRYGNDTQAPSTWVAHTPELTNCVSLGSESTPTAWQPTFNKQETDLTQTRTYESTEQCDVQAREINTSTNDVRLVGTTTNERVSVVNTESRDVTVTVTDWAESDVVDENNEWVPAIEDQMQPFTQTKAVSGTTHQERTFTYRGSDGVVLFSETETQLTDPDLDTRTIVPLYLYVNANHSPLEVDISDVTSLFGNYFDLQATYANCMADIASCDYVRLNNMTQSDIVASKLNQHHGNLENTILYGGITSAQLLDAQSLRDNGIAFLDSVKSSSGYPHQGLGSYATSYSYSLYERFNTETLMGYVPIYEDALNMNANAAASSGSRAIEGDAIQPSPINTYFATLSGEDQTATAATFVFKGVNDAHLITSHAYAATATQAISVSGTPCKHTGWDSDTEVPLEARCTEDYKLKVTFEPVAYTISVMGTSNNYYDPTPAALSAANSVTLETGFYSLGSTINQIWSKADFDQAIDEGTITF